MTKKAMVYMGKGKKQASIEEISEKVAEVMVYYDESVLVKASDNGLHALQSKGYRIRELNDPSVIEVNGFTVNIGDPRIRSTSKEFLKRESPSGRSYNILGVVGPLHPDWKKMLEGLGTHFYEVLEKDNYYLISIESDKVDELRNFNFVESLIPYFPSLKINPNLVPPSVRQGMSLEAHGAITIADRSMEDLADELPETPSDTSKELEPEKRISQTKPLDVEKEGNVEVVLFDESQLQDIIEVVRSNNAKLVR